MDWHPFAEKFPLLQGEEWEAFKKDIASTNGPNEPVAYRYADGKKQYLDGRNRWNACRELKIKCPTLEFQLTDAQALAFIKSKNLHRRHDLPKEIRAEIVLELRAEGQTTRQIAETLGVNQSTVVRDLQESVDAFASTDTKNIEEMPKNVTGKDGKTYPAEKPKPLCDRCQRTGATKDCPNCAELRKPKPKTSKVDFPFGANAEEKEEIQAIARSETKSDADGWGIPIQPHAAQAFEAQPLFDELLSVLRKADRLYSELAEHVGGSFLRRPGISVNSRERWKHNGIKNAILNVTDCKPTYTVCPYSYGKHHQHGDDCTLCHGLNWSRPLGKEEVAAEHIEAAKRAFGV